MIIAGTMLVIFFGPHTSGSREARVVQSSVTCPLTECCRLVTHQARSLLLLNLPSSQPALSDLLLQKNTQRMRSWIALSRLRSSFGAARCGVSLALGVALTMSACPPSNAALTTLSPHASSVHTQCLPWNS